MARTGLDGMPIELLVHIIATYLSTKDLGSLRLTSKFFERTLFDTFAKEFFTKKQFMLTTPSLTALIDISKHAALSKFVEHVVIGLEQYGARHHQFRDPVQFEKYRAGWADQDFLMDGCDREMLAEAFRNLPNLKTLGIRDYNAQGRAREDHATWNSWGEQTVLAETGIQLTCNPPSTPADFPAKVYRTLLLALADAETTVPSVEVILRNHKAGLSDFAFMLPARYDQKLVPVLEGLQTLLLTVNLFPQYHHQVSVLHLNPPGQAWMAQIATPPVHPQLFLPEFLLRAKNLRHLRLNFQKRETQAPAELLRQLVQSTGANLLPNLVNLDFGMMTASPELLLQVITKFAPSLRAVGFWKVCLTYTRSAQQSDNNKPNPWRNFLSHVLKIDNLNLTSMMLGCIHITDTLGPNIPVQFCNRSEEASLTDGGADSLEKTSECKGDMTTFLPQLISHLRVRWPKPVVVINIHEDEENDQNEDEEDDEEVDEDE